MRLSIQSPRQREQGVAVVLVLALLSIMLLYVAANVRSLHYLGRELKLVEQRQIHRLNSLTTTTNSVPGMNAPVSTSQPPPR